MIINHSRKFVFVHVPKTAGSAVMKMLTQLTTYRDLEIGQTKLGTEAFKEHGKRFGLSKHSSADTIRNVMGDEDWNGYFTFAFSRNPFSRLMSTYYFLKNWKGLPEWHAQELDRYPTFDSFLASDLWMSTETLDLYQPQITWLAPEGQGKPIVDFIGRQENLAGDMKIIADHIAKDFSFDATKKVNATPAYKKEFHWSEDSIAKVVEFYKSDFEHLGYSKNPKT